MISINKIMLIIKKVLNYIINKLYYLLLVIINVFIMYLCSSLNLFASLVTIDGASSMIDFVKNHSNKQMLEREFENGELVQIQV